MATQKEEEEEEKKSYKALEESRKTKQKHFIYIENIFFYHKYNNSPTSKLNQPDSMLRVFVKRDVFVISWLKLCHRITTTTLVLQV